MSFLVQQRAHIRPGKIKLADCLGYDRYDMYRFQGGRRHGDIRGVENDSSFLFKNIPLVRELLCRIPRIMFAARRWASQHLSDSAIWLIVFLFLFRVLFVQGKKNPSRACRCISIVYHLLVWGVLPKRRLVRLIGDALQVTGNTDRPGGYSCSML